MRETLYRELGGRFATLAMYPWAVEHFERILQRKVRPLTVGTVAWYDVSETFEDAYADCAHRHQVRPDDLLAEQVADHHLQLPENLPVQA
jgi:hypothetical protein